MGEKVWFVRDRQAAYEAAPSSYDRRFADFTRVPTDVVEAVITAVEMVDNETRYEACDDRDPDTTGLAYASAASYFPGTPAGKAKAQIACNNANKHQLALVAQAREVLKPLRKELRAALASANVSRETTV